MRLLFAFVLVLSVIPGEGRAQAPGVIDTGVEEQWRTARATTTRPALIIGLTGYEQWWRAEENSLYFGEFYVTFPLLVTNIEKNTRTYLNELILEGLPYAVTSHGAISIYSQARGLPEGITAGSLFLRLEGGNFPPGAAWDLNLTVNVDVPGYGIFPIHQSFSLNAPDWYLTIGRQIGALTPGEDNTVSFPAELRGLGDGVFDLRHGTWRARPTGLQWPVDIAVIESLGTFEISSDGTISSGDIPFWIGIYVRTGVADFWTVGRSVLEVGPKREIRFSSQNGDGHRFGASGSQRNRNDFPISQDALLFLPDPPPEPPREPPAVILRFTINSQTYTRNNVVYTTPTAPFLHPHHNHAMIPMRLTAEALGFCVYWDVETQTALIICDNVEVASIYYSMVSEWGSPHKTDDRFFVPSAFASDVLGAYVVWNEYTQVLYVILPLT